MTARALALLTGITLTLLLAAWVKPEAVDAALGKDVPAMRSAPALSSAAPIEPASPSRPVGLQSLSHGDTL